MLRGDVENALCHAWAQQQINIPGIGAMRIKAISQCTDSRYGIKYPQKACFPAGRAGKFKPFQPGFNGCDNHVFLGEYPVGKMSCRRCSPAEAENIKLYLFNDAGTRFRMPAYIALDTGRECRNGLVGFTHYTASAEASPHPERAVPRAIFGTDTFDINSVLTGPCIRPYVLVVQRMEPVNVGVITEITSRCRAAEFLNGVRCRRFCRAGRLTAAAIVRIVARAIEKHADGQRDFPHFFLVPFHKTPLSLRIFCQSCPIWHNR